MDKQKRETYSIGSTLRSRGKKPPADIGDIWSEQEIFEIENRKDVQSVLNIKKYAKLINKGKAALPKVHVKFNKKYALIMGVLVVGFILRAVSSDSSTKDTPDKLGVSTEPGSAGSGSLSSVPQLPEVADTDFDLLWPSGSRPDGTEVVKVSPPNNDSVYACISIFNGAELRISQQEIPKDFVSNVPEKVKEVAESFQARDVIQIDDTKVYHGFSEKNGGVQSLIFEKKGILVLIASPLKFTDEQWAGYIAAFK